MYRFFKFVDAVKRYKRYILDFFPTTCILHGDFIYICILYRK